MRRGAAPVALQSPALAAGTSPTRPGGRPRARQARPLLRPGGAGIYEALAESSFLPPLTSGALAHFLEDGSTKSSLEWTHEVREWARGR